MVFTPHPLKSVCCYFHPWVLAGQIVTWAVGWAGDGKIFSRLYFRNCNVQVGTLVGNVGFQRHGVNFGLTFDLAVVTLTFKKSKQCLKSILHRGISWRCRWATWCNHYLTFDLTVVATGLSYISETIRFSKLLILGRDTDWGCRCQRHRVALI